MFPFKAIQFPEITTNFGSPKRQSFRRIGAFRFLSRAASRISEGDLKVGRCVKVGVLPPVPAIQFSLQATKDGWESENGSRRSDLLLELQSRLWKASAIRKMSSSILYRCTIHQSALHCFTSYFESRVFEETLNRLKERYDWIFNGQSAVRRSQPNRFGCN
jgi:hypothetical protein